MNRHLMLPLALLLTAGFAHARPAVTDDLFQRIESSASSPYEALELKYKAMTDIQSLPDNLRDLPTSSPPIGCGTLAMRALREAVIEEGVAELQHLRPLFELPTQFRGQLPDGARARTIDAPNAMHAHNVSVYWGDLSDPGEAYRNDLLAALEYSWQYLIGTLGFPSANLDGDETLPVFIANTGIEFGGTELTAEPGLFAYVTTDTNGYAFMVFNDDLSFADRNDDPDGALFGAIRATAAHELFHTSHFRMDGREDAWWFEATSVWAEDEVFPQVNDYIYSYLHPDGSGWASNPHTSLTFFNGDHEYGSGIFVKYLTERVGCEDVVYDLWMRAADQPGPNIIPAMEGYFSDRGMTFREAFAEFSTINTVMDYAEGDRYAQVAVVGTVDSYNLGPLQINIGPDWLGNDYFFITARGGDRMGIDFDGDATFNGSDVEWEVLLVHLAPSARITDVRTIPLVGSEGSVVIDPPESQGAVMMIVGVRNDLGITPGEFEQLPYDSYPAGPAYTFEVYGTGSGLTGRSNYDNAVKAISTPNCTSIDPPPYTGEVPDPPVNGDDDDDVVDDDDDFPFPNDDDDDVPPANDDDDSSSGGCQCAPVAPTSLTLHYLLGLGLWIGFRRRRRC